MLQQIVFTYPRGTVVEFTISPEDNLYEMLKHRLFMRYLPSNRQFNLHMLALASTNYDAKLTSNDILDILKDKGILMVVNSHV